MAKTGSFTAKWAPSRAELQTIEDKAQFKTIEAVCRCTADILKSFDRPTLTRYESGFRDSLEEFARVLHPAGYDRCRTRSQLIAALGRRKVGVSKAHLPDIQSVRKYLDEFFAGVAKDPSDNRYLYGYEDGHWLIWNYVDPMGFKAANKYLPH